MVSQTRLRNNDRVSVSLLLGPALKFDFRARIVHAGPREGLLYKYGLKFLGLSEADYNRLSAFIHDPQHGWQFDAPPPPWEPESA